MKKFVTFVASFLIAVSVLLGSAGNALAYTYVHGYYKPSTGRYVMPYYRTNANSYKFDNFSSRGNYNIFTGKKGYKKW